MEKQAALSHIIAANFEQQVAFLQRLVRAKSANPYTPETSQPDTPVEQEVAAVTFQELQRFGFAPKLIGVTQERPNVVCTFPGSGSAGKTLILSTHMDTVEPSGYTRDPWGAQIEGGRLYGVGAADAKAQIAAFLYAVQALRDAGITPTGKVTLAFMVDEEPGACSPYGTQYLLERGLLSGDAAIIGEPGNSHVSTGHRGLYRFRLHIQGEATHTGRKAWEKKSRGREGAQQHLLLFSERISQTCYSPGPYRLFTSSATRVSQESTPPHSNPGESPGVSAAWARTTHHGRSADSRLLSCGFLAWSGHECGT